MKQYFSNKNNSKRSLSEINMVPLIDIMMVLLVIFMITAPLLTSQVNINLPTMRTQAQSVPDKIKPLTLSIKNNGDMFYDEKPVTYIDLKKQLHEQALNDNQRAIYIRADENVPYCVIAKMLSDITDEGLSHVAFVGKSETNDE
ncbi:biopolymer transporter ExbD [Escherichia albertii]|nr:biopolymer transporter ExbD [Escherichia albertii]